MMVMVVVMTPWMPLVNDFALTVPPDVDEGSGIGSKRMRARLRIDVTASVCDGMFKGSG